MASYAFSTQNGAPLYLFNNRDAPVPLLSTNDWTWWHRMWRQKRNPRHLTDTERWFICGHLWICFIVSMKSCVYRVAFFAPLPETALVSGSQGNFGLHPLVTPGWGTRAEVAYLSVMGGVAVTFSGCHTCTARLKSDNVVRATPREGSSQFHAHCLISFLLLLLLYSFIFLITVFVGSKWLSSRVKGVSWICSWGFCERSVFQTVRMTEEASLEIAPQFWDCILSKGDSRFALHLQMDDALQAILHCGMSRAGSEDAFWRG